MAKCFYCHHCGKCGPSSYNSYRNPEGLCPFCKHVNEPGAATCANCGKPLPKPAGFRTQKAEGSASNE